MYNPRDWYWIDASGRIFGSARGGIVAAPKADAALMAWRERGLLPTSWPQDDAGLQTDEALQSVLSEYGIYVSRKDALIAAVNGKRDAVIAAGYRHNFGGTAGIRTLDQRDARDETAWLSVKLITADMIAADQGATQIEIRDAGNETFRCSATTANAAMSAMGMWRSAVSSASWAIKDAIEAAEDHTAIDAIDIDEGWPE